MMSYSNPTAKPVAHGALIYAVHRTEAWWKHIGENLGYGASTVLTDRRGKGDLWLTDAFYSALKRHLHDTTTEGGRLDQAEIGDVIARCRVLRWLPRPKATAMILAMADAIHDVLADVTPRVVLSFPIDSYITDLLARWARAKGVPYYELTVGVAPEMSMLLHRGELAKISEEPDEETVAEVTQQLVDPYFAPAYVKRKSRYDAIGFLSKFLYFRFRGEIFRLYSHLVKDPLNLHYNDAQNFLGHKVAIRDISVLKVIDRDWKSKIHLYNKNRRIFLGLQVFPEASIDYWINDLDLVEYEDTVLESVKNLSESGYVIAVKDHPLQFGFRKSDFLHKLGAVKNVVIVPYDVSGNEVLAEVGINFTFTGTLGLQAALTGLTSITTKAYYVTEGDFVLCRTRSEFASLSSRLEAATLVPGGLVERQRRIVSNLLQGSFKGDFYSLWGFDKSAPDERSTTLARNLGERLTRLEDSLPAQRTLRPQPDHPGSPFQKPWGSDQRLFERDGIAKNLAMESDIHRRAV